MTDHRTLAPDALAGRVAVVTGGNSGIGRAIVLALAGAGAGVSKVADLQALVDTAVSTYGRLDIMINNAGVETRTRTGRCRATPPTA